jgi:O-antigen/teichoic acid export membrane protein
MGAGSRIAVTAAGAVTTIVLARLLGPAGWGTYFVAQSLFLLLTLLAGLGVEHGIAYYVGARKWGARAAYRAALKVAILAGCAAAALGLGARAIAPSAFAGLSMWLTAAVVVALPFGLVRFYVSYVALAIDRYEAYTLMSALQALLALVFAVPAAVLFGVGGAIVATTLATVAVGVTAALWAERRFPPSHAAEPGQLGRAISFGIKGYAANALQLLNYRLDVFILSAVASTAAVGRYSLAVAMTALIWLLPDALSEVLFPRVARLGRREDEVAREMVETKSLRHASLLVATATVLLAAALMLLVVPVFGEEFRRAVTLGLILLPGAALVGVSSVLAAIIVGRGKPIYTLYGALVVTPLTVLLYALLIPWRQAEGAAIASTLSYLGSFLLALWFYRRITRRPVLPLLVPTRSELHDLLAVPGAIRARLAGARR